MSIMLSKVRHYCTAARPGGVVASHSGFHFSHRALQVFAHRLQLCCLNRPGESGCLLPVELSPPPVRLGCWSHISLACGSGSPWWQKQPSVADTRTSSPRRSAASLAWIFPCPDVDEDVRARLGAQSREVCASVGRGVGEVARGDRPGRAGPPLRGTRELGQMRL
jgi:hypothetical protein